MKAYDVIFFDLDHTLVDTRGQYKEGLAVSLKQVYADKAPAGFADKFLRHHEALWGQYDRREITMQTLRRQRFLRAWRDYGVSKSDDEADHFHEVYNATFEHTLHPFAGVLDLVQTLAGDHRLGIITNGSPDLQWRKLGIAGLQPYFAQDAVVISENIGKAKPHPSVYQAACDALSVAKQDALMVGDNFVADVQGARNFGLDALWFLPDPQEPLSALTCTYGETPILQATEVAAAISALERQRKSSPR
ncbi:HAD family hydrolase [Alicyclobacillus sp. ALC3]|uniref:HAD family hydrolase n=1 Tax=Alicyclobacillus sp. ALC3 TaxID=2796143 RepID=UPI002379005A|nr:HAD family hydrolase [Alicyclobacillus sp. ALC3]WDL95881.1 HAD family hydrolase [Alicyclobacillus sp. ALC3]